MEKEFKVGDEVMLENWEKQEFKPYIKPIKKMKLQKFYCYDIINEGKIDAEGILIRYFFSKEIGECQFDIVLTEEEFLEKFEIK